MNKGKEECCFLKTYIEERAVEVANFIINSKATVRETAKRFGISKSTVHTVVSFQRFIRKNQNYSSPLITFS